MLIAQILAGKSPDVVTTRPDATIAEVAKLLKAKRIGAVVVTDADGGLCGIISERDLARGLADHGANLLSMRVGDLMTREVSTCSPGRRHRPADAADDRRALSSPAGRGGRQDDRHHQHRRRGQASLAGAGARGSHASRLHLRRRLRSRRFGHSRPEALLPRRKMPATGRPHRPLVSPSGCATEPASP